MKRDSKGRNTKMSTAEFIAGLPDEFKVKFDYSGTIYTGGLELIHYVCPIHGKQSMKAGKHSKSQHGCNPCARIATEVAKIQQGKLNFEKVIEERYKNQYQVQYSKYKSTKTELSFYCNIHNKVYKDIPMYAMKRHRCTVCRKEERSLLFRKSE